MSACLHHLFRPFLPIVLLFLYSAALSQSPDSSIDIQHYAFTLQLTDTDNSIRGEAAITLQYAQNAQVVSLDLVRKNASGKGMLVSSVEENGHPLRFTQDNDALLIYPSNNPSSTGTARHKPAPTNTTSHTYTIHYEGIPADGLIISTNKFGHRTFFGDNWPDRAHHWLPCADHPSDKATVDFIIIAPDHYQVISNGRKLTDSLLSGHRRLTHWNESAPLYTSLMVIGVADFAIDHSADVQQIPIYSYVFPENREQGFKDYAIAARILPFYIGHIGPYSYEKLANVQSKTIFGGMENASAIFYFENSVGDKNIESLMAHEIAHQWFGDAVTEKDWQQVWLSEGFATYMTHLYMENQYGPDTLRSGMDRDRKMVLSFEKRRFTPVVDTTVHDNYMQLLNANSYQKGGWVLHMLRRRIGDSAFWKGIAAYYSTYRNGNASTADLEKTMETASRQDLRSFFRQWVYSAGHPRLHISWIYTPDSRSLHMAIKQLQTTNFEFPLEFSIDGVTHTVEIHDKITNVQVPYPTQPSQIIFDPYVNVLAEFETP
jgi:aminopeptidase N